MNKYRIKSGEMLHIALGIVVKCIHEKQVNKKSLDAKASKCHLKFSSKIIIFSQAPMVMFSYFILIALKTTYSLQLK